MAVAGQAIVGMSPGAVIGISGHCQCRLRLWPDSIANFWPDRIARFKVQNSECLGILPGQARIVDFFSMPIMPKFVWVHFHIDKMASRMKNRQMGVRFPSCKFHSNFIDFYRIICHLDK